MSLFYEMHYHGYLDALRMMMQITDQVMLDEISNRCDWGTWLKLVLEKVEKKLQNAKSVGRLITTGKEQAHADF